MWPSGTSPGRRGLIPRPAPVALEGQTNVALLKKKASNYISLKNRRPNWLDPFLTEFD
jgi:hypothetical protein